MNEKIKKLLEQIKNQWSGWSIVQKVILFTIAGAVIVALFLVMNFSAGPARVAVIGVPVTDPQNFNNIIVRLDEEGIAYRTTEDNRVFVNDELTAQRARGILIRENLIPRGTDPWAIFDIERWTLTDFERDVNLRRAITRSVEQHILALEDVDAVSVNLVMPQRELFAENQNPVTASVQITPTPGSDITTNRRKIEGIVRLIEYAVEGLNQETIVITDHRGLMLNDFTGLEDLDRLELAQREMRMKRELENYYKNSILQALNILYPNRVQIINMDITLDTDKRTVRSEEYSPIVMTPDNPRTPFSEREVVPSIVLSEQVTDQNFEGTGFNPEGPPGQEGQTPPAYRDLEGLVGRYSENSVTRNNVVNRAESMVESSPWRISRVTIGVALDGIWRWQYDERGEVMFEPNGRIVREYTPLTNDDLAAARSILEPAVGFNRDRGDTVTVVHIPFDRSSQFETEDEEFRARQQMQRTIFYSFLGIMLLLVVFIAFRLIMREMERRRRLREEELARQHQAMREAALRSAEEEGVDVEMSVAERARLELQENAINMAREHPEDVAQLIRTWLAEE